MVPEELRRKRGKKIMALAPEGTAWCAGCQSFRDDEDFGKKATTCRACLSARTHGAMIEKSYGLTSDDYAALLAAQGGRCAICRAKPRSIRLAVDHDHASGAVRGLLCSRCNHDLMGAAWDSLAIAVALWHYLNTPPASGLWLPPERAPLLAPVDGPRKGEAPDRPRVVAQRGKMALKHKEALAAGECARPHIIPVGSKPVKVDGKKRRGAWRYFVEEGAEAPF